MNQIDSPEQNQNKGTLQETSRIKKNSLARIYWRVLILRFGFIILFAQLFFYEFFRNPV